MNSILSINKYYEKYYQLNFMNRIQQFKQKKILNIIVNSIGLVVSIDE